MFTAAALSVGARGIFVYPLLIGAGLLGALLMYGEYRGEFSAGQRAQAARIAHAAAFGVLDVMSGFAEEVADVDGW